MNLWTGYSVSEALRQLLALCFSASLFLAVWRVTRALRGNSKSRATVSVITARKSDTYNSNVPRAALMSLPSNPSTPTGIDKRGMKMGAARI